jgi:hypothetical protein
MNSPKTQKQATVKVIKPSIHVVLLTIVSVILVPSFRSYLSKTPIQTQPSHAPHSLPPNKSGADTAIRNTAIKPSTIAVFTKAE